MNHFWLESENFRLSLDLKIFESDIAYPCNTILTVSVFSEGFSATTDMDIDVKQISEFCENLKTIYGSFRGEAKISESYGKQNILFSCDRHGHIFVSGFLSWMANICLPLESTLYLSGTIPLQGITSGPVQVSPSS